MTADPIQVMEHRVALIGQQLDKIDQEIEQRQSTSKRILTKLNEQLKTYQEAKNDPQAITDQSGEIDFHRAREYVQRLIRQTKQQISEEEVACWKDIQQLTWERRELEREQAQLTYSLRLLRGGENDPETGL